MESKTSLEMYKAEKFEIRKENLYVNSKGSALLSETTAGCLRTKIFVAKQTLNGGVCVFCRKETGTIPHIVLECECIHPNPYDVNARLPEALGFKGTTRTVGYKAVEVAKTRLECWWTKSREGNIA